MLSLLISHHTFVLVWWNECNIVFSVFLKGLTLCVAAGFARSCYHRVLWIDLGRVHAMHLWLEHSGSVKSAYEQLAAMGVVKI